MSTGASRAAQGLILAAAVLAAGPAQAQSLAGLALAAALKQGGLVVVMRHARATPASPPPSQAAAGNVSDERQLDARGEADAVAMGAALRTLRIRFGEVWCSPTFRARQTARLAGLPDPRIAPELGDNGRSMQATGAGQADWLKARAAMAPPAGTDSFIVTQYPNITSAFGSEAAGMGEGGALVLRPDGKGGDEVIGRVAIGDWPALARP